MLDDPREITDVREKWETVGAIMTTFETNSTTVFDSTNVAPATSGPTSTLTFICNYATVIRTMPVLSHVIVKLPLVEDWSEPKSTYPMRALAAFVDPESLYTTA